MKKFLYGLFAAFLLCVLFALAGCSSGGAAPKESEAKEFLTTKKRFVSPYASDIKYNVEFIVEEDLSYSLSITYLGYYQENLQNYSATGSLTYLGSYSDEGSTTDNWNVTYRFTNHYNVYKLEGATVELNVNGAPYEHNFYLKMSTYENHSGNRDDFSLTLVAQKKWETELSARDVNNGTTEFKIR